jgi:glucose-1-phosphate cytidylyltransferase
MKTVILAGGFGSRLSEESAIRPKPMVEIGDKPILWHIMKIYSAHGINDFLICLGYKGYVIKEYFANYFLHMADVRIDLASNKMDIYHHTAEPWTVTLVDTGADTMTGGRIKRVANYLDADGPFCMTYGDGVGNVNIPELIAFHRKQGRLATVTAVQPPGRFGGMTLDGQKVADFAEKPPGDGAWINGGFFVLDRRVIERIKDDQTIWEQEPLMGLAAEGQLSAYKHRGFWQPMDTLRDKNQLNSLWLSGQPPWKVW